MARKFTLFESADKEFASLGDDAATLLLTLIATVAENPSAFRRRKTIRIEKMPDAGEHCIRISVGHEPQDAFRGWTAIVAVEDSKIVVLYATKGLEVTPDQVNIVRTRYDALKAALNERGHDFETWPPSGHKI